MASLDVNIENFNHNLKLLIRAISRSLPANATTAAIATVARVQKRIAVITESNPLMAVKIVGPRIFEYRDEIYGIDTADSASVELFVHRIGQRLAAADVSAEHADDAAQLIPLMLQTLRGISADECRSYCEHIMSMLDYYIEYLAAQK